MNDASILPVGRWLFAKKIVFLVACNPFLNAFIGYLFDNKIPHMGNRISVPPVNAEGLNSLLFFGFYESAEIRMIRKYLPTNIDVIELGSSIGGVSVIIANRLAYGSKLTCLEANPRLLEILEGNLCRNCPTAKFQVIHGAIDYNRRNLVPFELGSSTLNSRVTDLTTIDYIEVPAVTLNEIVEAAACERFALVCDIEGAEAAMLMADSGGLERCDFIVIELHDTDWEGKRFFVDDLIKLTINVTSMRLLARYGSVCVFSRN